MSVAEVCRATASGVILGQLAPGPNLLAVTGAALSSGRRAALGVAAGIAAVVFGWVTFATLGLAALLSVAPGLKSTMMVIGGAYLLVLGWRALHGALGPAASAITVRQGVMRGVLVNATNPKSAMMWGAVGTFMVGAGLSPGEVLAFAPIGAATALLVCASDAALFGGRRLRCAYARFGRVFEARFAAAFGLIGGRLLMDGVRELAR